MRRTSLQPLRHLYWSLRRDPSMMFHLIALLAGFSLFGLFDFSLIFYLLVFFLITYLVMGSLMMAVGAEELLQVVVGPRHLRVVVAVEQPRPEAAGNLEEVLEARAHRRALGCGARQRAQQTREAPTHGALAPTPWMGQQVGHLVDPTIGGSNRRPQGFRRRQSPFQQGAQPGQLARKAPFFAARSRLATTAFRRSCNFRPDADSGGRPSSVSALRTAAQ